MTIEIDENEFTEDKENNKYKPYNTETVSYLLEEMKTRLPDNVFLLNKIDEFGNMSNVVPHMYTDKDRHFHNSLGDHLKKVIEDQTIFPNEFAIATVINVEQNHYLSVVFRQEKDVKTLVIHDPLGTYGKTKGYDQYADKIKEAFIEKFGAGINVEINPKNNVLYQSDINSCGAVCVENLETTLNKKEFTENPKLGIKKDEHNEFRVEENAPLLRAHQLEKLQNLESSQKFAYHLMEGKDSMSASELVEKIFSDKTYSSEKKNSILNKLMDEGLIEGDAISKDVLIKTLNNPVKTRNLHGHDVQNSDNITVPTTPNNRTGKSQELRSR